MTPRSDVLTESRTKRGDAGDGRALGARITRVDGLAKVRGAATYSLEHRPADLAHAVLVGSTIAAGRVRRVDQSEAEKAPGVRLILTPDTIPALKTASNWLGERPSEGPYHALTHEIGFQGQHVAAVVADTLEQAVEAARLVTIEYDVAPAVADLRDSRAGAGTEVEAMTIAWGDAEAALEAAPAKIRREYTTPREYNVPIEPHGLIAEWQDEDHLTIWEPSQWIAGMARTYAEWFEIPYENLRMISPYIGGGFGSKALAYSYGAIAAQAAKLLGRPVKLAVTRPQTFTAYGGRAETRQEIALGATLEGKLLAIHHRAANETSTTGTWVERCGGTIAIMYATPNFSSKHRVVPVNTVLPSAFRAPGENPSAWGIESAIDELAYEIGLDPLAIRLLNYAEHDHQANLPWSSRQLREAFAAGAERFGWSKRSPAPRSMRAGSQLIGWGVAAGTYPMRRTPGQAIVRLLADGAVEVLSAAIDMGQGTYTILAQTAAEALAVPVERVAVRLGDSSMPWAPVGGGSQLANLMVGAVHKAALAARDELIGLALNDPKSPLRHLQANTLPVGDGRIGDLEIGAFLAAIGRDHIEVLRDTFAENGKSADDPFKTYTTITGGRTTTDNGYSAHSWCAHFIEVRVDEDFGTVRVSRVVSAFDCGRIFNPKLAESQWKGGIIQGIGQALLEEGVVDRRHGRVINNNLGDYLIPTNADVPDIEVISVGVPDFHATMLGGKGVGEVPIVGVAPAIANAVFHATGKRIRDLPITLDKLIG
ncbi:xanthine dehydrogenase family protein molybdopterin-binding subunit [Dongia sedimenti]|uniref:Xanthine dehydrogenase family protein molybdopterin-binding subunit n=1 Tax=Dongia sedimenti TaxID=3064282 RepID=A0ABU0YSQ9_9PROT|nr:xanthine dehydrogenase family protein molybdopterin-binding subunit [Rhodospirillaceae bacterium R-7]